MSREGFMIALAASCRPGGDAPIWPERLAARSGAAAHTVQLLDRRRHPAAGFRIRRMRDLARPQACQFLSRERNPPQNPLRATASGRPIRQIVLSLDRGPGPDRRRIPRRRLWPPVQIRLRQRRGRPISRPSLRSTIARASIPMWRRTASTSPPGFRRLRRPCRPGQFQGSRPRPDRQPGRDGGVRRPAPACGAQLPEIRGSA